MQDQLSLVYVKEIDQFRYIKIQPKTIDLSVRIWGIATEFVGFISQSLVPRSIVLGFNFIIPKLIYCCAEVISVMVYLLKSFRQHSVQFSKRVSSIYC